MTFDELKEKAHALPLKPGVYIMQDAKNVVIYVGKAKALKNRVSQYFANLASHTEKTRAMVSQIDHFDVIVADSEFEALVLENSLIKRHQPRYNILLKDGKGYPYIRLDARSEYPTFSLTNRYAKDGARYFGPFGGRSVTKDIIDTVSKALLLPSCTRKFPRDIGKARPCLNYHMGACAGWCMAGHTAEEYRAAMEQAALILSGKTKELTEELTEKMLAASDELKFELAASYRDRIRAVEGLGNRQRVISAVYADTDAVGFHRGAKSCFSVLHFVGGDLAAKDFELMDEPLEDDGEALSGLIRQYYAQRGAWPKFILLPAEAEDAEALSRLFTEQAGHKVSVETPKRGDRLRLVESAVTNAREEAERVTSREERVQGALGMLCSMLNLPKLERIEAYDISNLAGSDIVASMTVFQDGKPLKKNYKHFKLQELDDQNDYESMRQIIERRFRRLLQGDEGFSEKPDALFIDGGAVHAGVVERQLAEMGLSIPVFGMVKDNRHRTRALTRSDGSEIGIAGQPPVFALVGRIQEETHRFAITYNQTLRSRRMRGSELDTIEGIGPKRREQLLRRFKSMKRIREATREQLLEVLPQGAAEAVYAHYHPHTEEETTP